MKRIGLVFALSVFICLKAFSQNIWKDVSGSSVTTTTERYIIPAAYKTYAINLEELIGTLNNAPKEFSVDILEDGLHVKLPLPNGDMQQFSVVESSLMPQNLAVKFPNIKSYVGQGLDDKTATVRMSVDHNGFHAMIISATGTVYIDPYSLNDTKYCITYLKEDFYATNTKVRNNQCLLSKAAVGTKLVQMPGGQSGDILRIYRAAIACTGEYTTFHGGAVADAMAAINTTLNRINGVYEREASFRLILVENNDDLIYTNSYSDPYSNGEPNAMINENQDNIDGIIGSNNYDIGHVFGTNSGGLAGLGVVCSTGQKANGVTGSNAPVGDAFDIDYVCHEMGHQFGGNHTQNNSCNRTGSAAYEPGSASTIMGYAGICSPNLQNNSDDYYHTYSFDQITAHVNGETGENDCAQHIETGNNIPVANTGIGGFTIPVSTPFELIGSGSDIDDDELTYCWEEFDLGPVTNNSDNNLTNPSGNQPIFRSWPPTSSSKRVFPRMQDLLNGTTTTGEHLPTYSRSLTFRLTVRDNNAGGGGVSYDQMVFDVSDAAGPFTVNTITEYWEYGIAYAVNWDVANTNITPVNCSTVDIYLSLDGGTTFDCVLAQGVPNSGSADVVCPNVISSQARIKVKAADNIFFNISNVFQIQGSSNIPGCTDITRCNYNSLATTDDGSCLQALDGICESCSGATYGTGIIVDNDIDNNGVCNVLACTNNTACNYNEAAEQDNGLCEYPAAGYDCEGNCVDGALLTFGGGLWVEETSFSIAGCDGVVVFEGGGDELSTICVELPENYTITMNDSYGDGWNGNELTIGDATYTIESGSEVFVDMGCVQVGCTDTTATNYDLSATVDDGSCQYASSNNIQLLSALNYDVGLNDVWGYVDAFGNEYAIVGLETGTSIVDVTNPVNPIEKAFIPGPTSIWRDIKTWGNYAYVVHDNISSGQSQGLLIIDLSDISNGNVSSNSFFFNNQISTVHNIYVDENGVIYLFGGNYSNGGALMFDIATDPENPIYLGEFEAYYLHDGMVRGDTLWGAAINEGLLVSIDVTDKSNPQIMGSHSTPNNFTHNCWISDDGDYLFTTDEVTGAYVSAYDVSDLNDIEKVDQIQSWSPQTNVIPHNTHVKGNYLVTSYYCDGVSIVDASDPNNLQEVAYFDTSPNYSGGTFNGAWGAYPWLPSNNLLVSDQENGLHILAVSIDEYNTVYGCADSLANNYNTNATQDDGSCEYTCKVPGEWEVENTGSNMTLMIPDNVNVSINGVQVSIGSALGVFYEDSYGNLQAAGYAYLLGDSTHIAVMADDVTTEEIDGLVTGNEMIWKIWDVVSCVEYSGTATFSMGSNIFEPNGIAFVESVSYSCQDIEFPSGWFMFSTYIELENKDIASVLSSLGDNIIIVKNNSGNAYLPDWDFNGIGDLENGQGYNIKLEESDQIGICGDYLIPEFNPIALSAGWNMIGYLRLEPTNVEIIMESLVTIDNLIIVKDYNGNPYLPEWSYNGIGNMHPSQGYQLKVNEADTIHFLSNNQEYRLPIANGSENRLLVLPR